MPRPDPRVLHFQPLAQVIVEVCVAWKLRFIYIFFSPPYKNQEIFCNPSISFCEKNLLTTLSLQVGKVAVMLQLIITVTDFVVKLLIF